MNILRFQDLEKFYENTKKKQIEQFYKDIEPLIREIDDDYIDEYIDDKERILFNNYKLGKYSFLSFEEFTGLICQFESNIYEKR